MSANSTSHLLIGCVLGVVMGISGAVAWYERQNMPPLVGSAHADEARTTVEIKLAPGQKLVDVSWHCFSDFACAPFVLTRAMRKDEASETYGLSSLDADIRRSYVIKESR